MSPIYVVHVSVIDKVDKAEVFGMPVANVFQVFKKIARKSMAWNLTLLSRVRVRIQPGLQFWNCEHRISLVECSNEVPIFYHKDTYICA